jgi:hypothetical protein
MGPMVVEEGSLLAFAVAVTDPDGDALTVAAEGVPEGASFNAATRTFTWTPRPADVRLEPYVVRFTATDGSLSDALDVSILVRDVNHAPQFVGLQDQTVLEGDTLQFTVVATDQDGDPVSLSAEGPLPLNAVFEPATGRFTWMPAQTQVGDHEVRFRASDGTLSTVGSIVIHVLDTNRPPQIGAVADRQVREGTLLQFTVLVEDPDGDPVSVQLSPLPTGAQFGRQGSGWTFQWVPGDDQAGTYRLELQATDGIIAQPVSATVLVTVLNNPALQPLLAQVGVAQPDGDPATTPVGRFGELVRLSLGLGESVGLDLGEVHPALVSRVELFHTQEAVFLSESDLSLWVSDDNVRYEAYAGPSVVTTSGNRLILSNLRVPERYLKIHRHPGGNAFATLENYLPELTRAMGAVDLDAEGEAWLEALGRDTFQYFLENVNAIGLIPDRIHVDGAVSPSDFYSTAAAGFWLSALPIAAEHGWISREDAQVHATRTLETYLGVGRPAAAGQFGFFYHFLNADGTRFAFFSGDGVSIIDSTLLFAGALACGEYFGGAVKTLTDELIGRADWDAFYDHDADMLHLFWSPEAGFVRHLDYTSEGILAYLLAAGSTTNPIAPDPDLVDGADAYYAFSRGNFGRVLGRFGRDGRPLLQSFFGSLFTYLYPTLLADLGGVRDAFHVDWAENAREAIRANVRFAQEHPEAGYGRLVWGISASDGPTGYEGLYGTDPLDPGAIGGPRHDGTVASYALAGSLPFAADLALPALRHVATLEDGRLTGRYGLKDSVNPLRGFFAADHLGIDQGALLLGLDGFRTGVVGGLLRQSAYVQRALDALGFHSEAAYTIGSSGPRAAHAYLLINSSDQLSQTILTGPADTSRAGEALLELHPYGIDPGLGRRFVDVLVVVNDVLVRIPRFADRRGDGTVDVGSVYVPVNAGTLGREQNTVRIRWLDGERWVQLEDVELRQPTGRRGTQETWQLGVRDGSFAEFGDERLADDSCFIGDPTSSCERALHVVDEPATDLLFELADLSTDRRLRLVAAQTQEGLPVTVEVSANGAILGDATLASGQEATVTIPALMLASGWNHVQIRHKAAPADGQFILWDALALEELLEPGVLQVIVRDQATGELAGQLAFGLTPPEGALVVAPQYLDVRYGLDATFNRVTINTDNRNGTLHRFTGPPEASAAGLVGEVDSTVTVPLLWQVYDERQPSLPAFTNTTEWAFVPDASESNFSTPEAIAFRSVVVGDLLGERPSAGRVAISPVALYLAADFRGKPAQMYGTDRLVIDVISQ